MVLPELLPEEKWGKMEKWKNGGKWGEMGKNGGKWGNPGGEILSTPFSGALSWRAPLLAASRGLAPILMFLARFFAVAAFFPEPIC